jgi:hypothetical protein
MEDILNISFVSSIFPYANFKKVSDLINHDGPILSHFSDGKRHLLYLWIDNDEIFNRWLIFEVDKNSLLNYLYKNTSLLDLILNNKQEFLLISDINGSLEYEFNNLIEKVKLPQVYLPTENSYFQFKVPLIYTSNDAEQEYLHVLVSDSISLKIESKTRKYTSAVKVDNLLNVLKNVKQSFTNYISINFRKSFSESDFENLNFNSLLSTIVKDSELLIPNLAYGSFCASLTTDYLMSKEFSPVIQKWRKETFIDFKHEVIEADYDINSLDVLTLKYDEFERRAIYSPIVEISRDSNDYKISITDNSFRKIKKILTPISKPIRERLMPRLQPSETVKSEALFQIIGLAEKNAEELKLSKRGILETKELDYAELTQSTDTISFKSSQLYLKDFFEFKIIYDRGTFIIDYPPLDLHLENISFDSVKSDFYKTIIDLYSILNKLDNDQLSLDEISIKHNLVEMIALPNID